MNQGLKVILTTTPTHTLHPLLLSATVNQVSTYEQRPQCAEPLISPAQPGHWPQRSELPRGRRIPGHSHLT